MGPTLFRYIFKDLVKVFLLAAVSIAGILSFAGLLRPLTERGLGAEEALRILLWLMPAMMAYSLPVAALFATTFVYGRLSADNETVAAKAAGIPAAPGGLLWPAIVLAAGLGAVSLGMLCFVVPAANLQVEQAIWSNLARLAANNINRTSRITFSTDAGGVTVFADRAILPTAAEVDEARRQALAAGSAGDAVGISPDVQVVQLQNAYVIRYEPEATGETLHDGDPLEVPGEIFAARTATIYIDPPAYARGAAAHNLFSIEQAMSQSALADDQFAITVVLEDGLKFPRSLGLSPNAADPDAGGPLVAAARATQFGPIRRDTPVRVNPKFMDVRELQALLQRPEMARRIVEPVRRYARSDQRRGYLRALRNQATQSAGVELDDGADSSFTFQSEADGIVDGEQLVYQGIPLRMVQTRPIGETGQTETIEIEASFATVEAEPLAGASPDERPRLLVVFTFPTATVTIDGRTTENRAIERRLTVTMPDDLAALPTLTAEQYLAGDAVALGGTIPDVRFAAELRKELAQQKGGVVGELYARLAFIVACIILPIFGAALGMMFRSGNFLTAFAISTIPAAVCVLMIVVGQQILEAKPRIGPEELANPALLEPSLLGIAVIWSGDAVVLAGSCLLLWRLRQR